MIKSITNADIKNILNEEKRYLKESISDGKNPYHTFILATLNSNQSEARTVVLRDLKEKPLTIFFNADYRSSKIKQLHSNNICTALFYNPQRRVQLRFKATSIIHYDNIVSKSTWKKTPLQSRKCYMGKYTPGERLSSWSPNIPSKYLKIDPDKEDSESGLKNFTCIELKTIEIDILKLYHDGHIRFKVDNNNNMKFIAP